MPAVLPQEYGVKQPAETDEGKGDDDEESEGLYVRDDHHYHELEDVHQLVEGALDTVDHAALPLHHHLQEQLRDGQVRCPQTYVTTRPWLVSSVPWNTYVSSISLS